MSIKKRLRQLAGTVLSAFYGAYNKLPETGENALTTPKEGFLFF